MHKFCIYPPRKRFPSSLAILLAGALTASTAWAGRPLVTEDAGVLARGDCEWESFVGRQGSPRLRFGSTQLGCGIGGASQLALGGARTLAPHGNASAMTLSGKTAFGAPGEGDPRLALAYTLFGAREASDKLDYTGAEIKGVLTQPWAGWLLHANAGLLLPHGGHDRRTIWAFAIERPGAIGALDLMAEVHGDDRGSPWVQAATRWTALPGRLYFDASVGIHTNGRHARLATLGMKLAF